jgi:hypothetical protein
MDQPTGPATPATPATPAAPAAPAAPPTEAAGQEPVTELVIVPGGLPDMDAELKAIIEEAKGGKKLRVRLPFTVLLEGDDSYQYTPLKKVAWVIEFRSPELASPFREDLDAFLRAWALATAAGSVVKVSVEPVTQG